MEFSTNALQNTVLVCFLTMVVGQFNTKPPNKMVGPLNSFFLNSSSYAVAIVYSISN